MARPSPLTPATWLKFAGLALATTAVFALVAGLWFSGKLHGSLPQLDGVATVPGLGGPVTIERDRLGVPTIHANTAADAARALGFLHGQDRFFQMDLTRRRAAGELSELVGKAALGLDEAARTHEFRRLARTVVAHASPQEQQLLDAYAAGVNAGLAALTTKPFEYLVLRAKPQEWKPEDSVLILYAMTLTLQDQDSVYKRSLATLWDTLGPRAFAFFAPVMGPHDAALDGTVGSVAPIPPASVLDLRTPAAAALTPAAGDAFAALAAADAAGRSEFAPGSNAFAVSGEHTPDGVAILANDMHLPLGVPNIWYRAQLVWGTHRLTGVTLPGTPYVVAGSNGHVAWGFTSAYTDTGDLIVLTMASPQLYHGPDGQILTIEHRTTEIPVKDAAPVAYGYDWTAWGPIIGRDPDQRPLVYHWTADDPASVNIDFMPLANATTLAEALAAAHALGIPNENFVAADESGQIGWTIAGRLPRRVGFDGRLPVSWQYGDRKWDGYLPGSEIPTVTRRDRLWSANQRMLGGEAFNLLGDGGAYSPGRAAQIRDDLTALVGRKPHGVTPADLLAIQLDDQARFLEPWQQLALRALTPGALAQHPDRAAFRTAVENWGDRAQPDSVGYRLVRDFRLAVAGLTLSPIFAPCTAADPDFDWSRFHFEEPLWTLLRAQPPHLLNPQFSSWDALLIGAVDATIRRVQQEGATVEHATWGSYNTLAMVHPFSRRLPGVLGRWLDLPAEQLPGGDDMPRIQGPAFGASERLVVAPSQERAGIFEMPGGESGHPRSPYYRAGHESWVHGEPTPFLPGAPVHTLTLDP